MEDQPIASSRFSWQRLAFWALVLVIVAPLAYYLVLRIFVPAEEQPLRLVVYGFSTQEELFTQGIFPAFEQKWEAEHGGDLQIVGVFGPSGTLAGQINLGAPADIALLSNAEHSNWLKIGRMVDESTQPVVYACTPMVIVFRPVIAIRVQEYADLATPGLRLLHADPRSSGGGEWAVLAEYGSALLETGDPEAARQQLKDIWKNVRMMSVSARGALTQYELLFGDALVTYEQDALLAQDRGVPLQIAVPKRTILAQPVALLVDKNLTAAERPAAQAFIDFLVSAEGPSPGQAILSRYHLRPALPLCQGDPALEQPFTVEALGGWSRAYQELVAGVWQEEAPPWLGVEAR